MADSHSPGSAGAAIGFGGAIGVATNKQNSSNPDDSE